MRCQASRSPSAAGGRYLWRIHTNALCRLTPHLLLPLNVVTSVGRSASLWLARPRGAVPAREAHYEMQKQTADQSIVTGIGTFRLLI